MNKDLSRNIITSILLSLFLTLSGCGGGGGGGGGGAAVTGITTANAEDVASATYASTSVASGFGDLASGIVTGVVIEAEGAQFNYIDFAKSQLDKFSVLQEAAFTQGIIGVVIEPIVVPCDNEPNGTMTITGNIADESTLTTGDFISFSLDNCDIGSDILDGGFTITLNQVNGINSSGDLIPPYSVSMTLAFSNLTDGYSAIDGDITLATNSNDGLVVTSSISGSSIEVSQGARSVSISAFSFALTETLSTETATLNGTVNISSFSSAFSFETREPFVANIIDNYPYTGLMVITGPGNSSVKIRAIDAFNVMLEVDADGDNITDGDGTILTTWAALDS